MGCFSDPGCFRLALRRSSDSDCADVALFMCVVVQMTGLFDAITVESFGGPFIVMPRSTERLFAGVRQGNQLHHA